MADFLRPSDSWSTTEICTANHSHCWTVKGFSQCDCRYLETTVKVNPQSGASSSSLSHSSRADEPLSFRIRLHPQGNKDSNKDFTFFQVFCNTQGMKYRAKFTVYNSKNDEVGTTIYTGTQQLHGYFEYIRRDTLLAHLQPSDELHLWLNLTLTYDTVTKSSQTVPPPIAEPSPRVTDVAQDFMLFYEDIRGRTHLCDFKVICESAELPCHMAVLAARSPYFAALLEEHTAEYQQRHVVVKDIDKDTMQELLFYMYSGQSPNLQNNAYQLLAAADRFHLLPLKDMADQMLRTQLHIDGVCRDLILADRHEAHALKSECMTFIANNAQEIIGTEGWDDLRGSALISEVAMAISTKGTSSSTSRPSAQPPVPSMSTSTSSGGGSRGLHSAQNNGPSGNKRSRLAARTATNDVDMS